MTRPSHAQSERPANAGQDADLDPNALAAIRDMMAAEPEIAAEDVAQRASRRAEMGDLAPPEPQKKSKPAKAKRAAKRATKNSEEGAGLVSRLMSRVRGIQITRKRLIFGAVVLLALFRPWLVIGLIVLSLLIVAGAFVALGYDGFWQRAIGLARRYARRNPERAAELHRKLDSFAMGWDAFLDRFPEGSVDGLYLPDFGELAQADARYDAALDRRFKDMRESEV